MLLLGIVQDEAELHALARQFAIGQLPRPVRMVASPPFVALGRQLLARRAVRLPSSPTISCEIGDQQIGRGLADRRRGGRNCRGCSC